MEETSQDAGGQRAGDRAVQSNNQHAASIKQPACSFCESACGSSGRSSTAPQRTTWMISGPSRGAEPREQVLQFSWRARIRGGLRLGAPSPHRRRAACWAPRPLLEATVEFFFLPMKTFPFCLCLLTWALHNDLDQTGKSTPRNSSVHQRCPRCRAPCSEPY